MKLPYLQKIKEVGGVSVWEVDGAYVREKIEKDFTNFAQHFMFAVIPENELWLDVERAPGEEEYFIHNFLAVRKFVGEGCSYREAVKRADAIEKKERLKSDLFKKLKLGGQNRRRKTPPPEIYKKPLRVYSSDSLAVWLINGELARDLYYLDFTEGGHGYVYDFVPLNEVWIDDDLPAKERKFVVLHELHERNLMKEKGWPYEKAHHSASELEYKYRRHPALLSAAVGEELKRAEKEKSPASLP